MKFRNKGFTLLELLVVVAIIGILTTVVIASINSARAKTRDARRMHDIQQINTAIALYQSDHGGLPPDLGSPNCIDFNAYMPSCFADTGEGLTNWQTLAVQLHPYISIIPEDPCPTCSADAFLLPDAYAASYDFEYVYHAPAAVNAYLQEHNINPIDAGVRNSPYSIYAKNLETRSGAYGFGLSVPGVYPEVVENICPYLKEKNSEDACKEWMLCNEGDEGACKWLNENGLLCPYIDNKDGAKLCELWTVCNQGNEDACKQLESL